MNFFSVEGNFILDFLEFFYLILYNLFNLIFLINNRWGLFFISRY